MREKNCGENESESCPLAEQQRSRDLLMLGCLTYKVSLAAVSGDGSQSVQHVVLTVVMEFQAGCI